MLRMCLVVWDLTRLASAPVASWGEVSWARSLPPIGRRNLTRRKSLDFILELWKMFGYASTAVGELKTKTCCLCPRSACIWECKRPSETPEMQFIFIQHPTSWCCWLLRSKPKSARPGSTGQTRSRERLTPAGGSNRAILPGQSLAA